MGEDMVETEDATERTAEEQAEAAWRGEGGSTPRPRRRRGRPVVHGAYSRAVKAEDMATLKGLRVLGMGLEEEVALARLQLARAVAWADAERPVRCDGKQCPYQLVDSRLSLVSRVAVRCQRIAEGISAQIEEEEWITRIVEAINRHVTDEETRVAIMRDIEEGEPRDGRASEAGGDGRGRGG